MRKGVWVFQGSDGFHLLVNKINGNLLTLVLTGSARDSGLIGPVWSTRLCKRIKGLFGLINAKIAKFM